MVGMSGRFEVVGDTDAREVQVVAGLFGMKLFGRFGIGRGFSRGPFDFFHL